MKLLSLTFILLCLVLTKPAQAGKCKPLIDGLSQVDNIAQLQQALYCLDNSNTTSTRNISQLTRPPIKHTAKVEKYLFELNQCHRQQRQVFCTVYITNHNSVAEKPKYNPFGLLGEQTSFFDEYGDEYTSSLLEIGNSRIEIDKTSRKSTFLKKYMPLGITMKANIAFDNVPAKVTTVRALNISFNYRETNGQHANKIVTLQNVAVSGGS